MQIVTPRKAVEVTVAFALVCSAVYGQRNGRGAQLPDAPGRDVVKSVCGGCHPAETVLGKGMTREQWQSLVSNMISRGAKGSEADFATVIDYLTANLGPSTKGVAPTGKAKGGGLLDQAGASDKHVVDDAAATRGQSLYAADCVNCHGPRGRGTPKGPDVVRSLVVLSDRYGDTVGPFLRKGHPMQSGGSSNSLSQAQIEDLSHFLHQKVGDTLRTGPYNKVLNMLTGDSKAGEAYFNGPGKCSTCHSVTGDLAGISKRYDPATLQLKVVFPQTVAFGRRMSTGARKPVTVTVKSASGESVTGVLDHMDDFSVSLRDSEGNYHSFERTPDIKVEKKDPYAEHVALLDHYADSDIHNVVAYLETLK